MRRKRSRSEIWRDIQTLVRDALEKGGDLETADRWVELARKLSMKSRVPISQELKSFICDGCKGVLIPGVTARHRIRPDRETHLVVTCKRCGHVYRRSVDG